MTRLRRGRWALIARGLLLLAAVLLLPLAAMVQPPRESAALPVAQDSLWAGTIGGNVGTCVSPSAAAALAGCFSSPTSTWPDGANVWVNAAASDGVNVYFVSASDGGLSCPIADLGANCTRIMAGPWPQTNLDAYATTSIAAADGYLWFGQNKGEIYRCPADLPWQAQDTMPSECVMLDDAGARPVNSLLLANGTLYAGLGSYGTEQKKQGLLWSCSPNTVNACGTLDSYGNTYAPSLAAGGGYLWAGLDNGIIWRCDLNAVNACANWEQAGGSVHSLSYDGEDTLYAAINSDNGVIWSCPTAYANGCSNVISDVVGWSVAAGEDSVFSSSSSGGLQYGTSPFTAANVNLIAWYKSFLLYLPADGTVGVGGVKVTMTANSLGQKLEKRCEKPGKTARATVTIEGPNGFTKTLTTGVCGMTNGGRVSKTVDLLDPGEYTVTATAGKRSGQETFTIEPDRTRPVNVKLRCAAHG